MPITTLILSLSLFIFLLTIPRQNFKFWRKGKGGSWYRYESALDGYKFWIQFQLEEYSKEVPQRYFLIKEEHYG